jgi:hypothetical protein
MDDLAGVRSRRGIRAGGNAGGSIERGVTNVFDVSLVIAAQPTSRTRFESVTARPADTKWDASAPSRVEARRAASGHLLVHPLVNGQDVGWFLLVGVGVLRTFRIAFDFGNKRIALVPLNAT